MPDIEKLIPPPLRRPAKPGEGNGNGNGNGNGHTAGAGTTVTAALPGPRRS